MTQLFVVVAVLALFGVSVAAYTSRLPPAEASRLQLGAAVHVIGWAALLAIYLFYYGYGDMLGYHRRGSNIATAILADPARVGWETVKVVFQQEATLSEFTPRNATGSMTGISAFVCLFTANSIWAAGAVFAFLSYWSKVALYRSVRGVFAPASHRLLALACLAAPSAVIWTAGIVKEAVAMIGLNFAVAAMVDASRRRFGLLWLAVPGLTAAALVKPYLIVVIGAAGGAYLVRGAGDRARVHPVLLAVGLVAALLGVVTVGSLESRLSLDAVTDEATRLQTVGFTTQLEGSNYQIGNPSAGVVGQLPYLPLALATGLYRPFLIECTNPVMLLNGLETTAFLWFTLVPMRRHGLVALTKRTLAHPFLVFCVVFVGFLGIATAFTSSNLGTLSRYRAPLVPFFAILLVAWNQPDSTPAR